MKLQAVTVCVNYSDFLECIAPNRRHFDRWVVVTVPLDRATVEVCERHGMEVIFTKALPPDGKGIHGLWHKSALINEGLEALDQAGWVVVMDSDVSLPRDFRERLSHLPLEPGLLYGVAGRKVCACANGVSARTPAARSSPFIQSRRIRQTSKTIAPSLSPPIEADKRRFGSGDGGLMLPVGVDI